ncbi:MULTISPECIES: AMP-binding protein [Actinomycetes]|uniref:AMP-binding protein n=1 Tax=Actinomycetes TaxID=1760 RepID=UPI000A907409|nr:MULTISPECIES: AMP-binding protein [Actinomycetes]
MTELIGRIRRMLWTIGVLVRSGMLAPLRPDKYLRMGLVIWRQGTTPMTGLGLAAVRRPNATALVDELGSLTWAQLDTRSDALATALRDLRREPDQTVGILCRNHRGLVESLLASTKLGADSLLLNTGFSGPQLTEVLLREHTGVLIYDEEFADLVAHARSHVADLAEVIAWTDSSTDAPTVEGLINKHRGAKRPGRPDSPGRIVLLTSGTTGTPKGARRSGGGGAGALAAMFDRIPWKAEEKIVVAAPMFHAWGFGQLAVAGTMTCTVVMRRKFDPEATLKLVAEHRATGLALVPVMLERIMDLPSEVLDHYQLSSLRFATVSGSRMRADAVTGFMDRFGDVVYNSYNATEAGLISTATPADLRAATDTAGRPAAGTEVRILDDNLDELPVGEVGKIAVFSNSHFEGYTSGDSKDFHGDFMLSGDVGRLDENGRLFVVGRDDDMIVSGGENVYPLEVEETLNAHPSVLEAAVLGVDDDKYGQRLAAYVVLKPGEDASCDDLKAHVKSQLAGFKVPRDVEFLDALPRNATGKVVKRELTGPA